MFNAIMKNKISKKKLGLFFVVFFIVLILMYSLELKEAFINLQGENLKFIDTSFYNIKASGISDKINLSKDVTITLYAESCSIFYKNELVFNTSDTLVIETDGNVSLSDNNDNQIGYQLYAISRNGLMSYYNEGLPFENEHRRLNASQEGDIYINNLCPLERGQNHDWLLEFDDDVSINRSMDGEISDFTNEITVVANNIKGLGTSTYCQSIKFDNDITTTQFKDDWTFTAVEHCKANIKGVLTFSKGKKFQDYNIGNQDVTVSVSKHKLISGEREELAVNLSHIENTDDFKVYVSGNVGKAILSETNLFYTLTDFFKELTLGKTVIGFVISAIINQIITEIIIKIKTRNLIDSIKKRCHKIIKKTDD